MARAPCLGRVKKPHPRAFAQGAGVFTSGGKVFVDSGAFGAYQAKTEMDWGNVLDVYDCLVDMTQAPGNLWVVSPDQVGNQEATLQLLQKYRQRVLELVASGCNVIVPIQCGSLPGQQMIEAVATILGTHRWIAGIPSNKEAMTVQECRTLNHHAFHILGRVQQDQAQTDRMAALRCQNPHAVLTADANWLRSRMGSVCTLTEQESHRRRTAKTASFSDMLDHPRSRAVARAIQADRTWGLAS